ncbi:aqualysin-1-like [Asterias amurensis]|uniref:aqualysin-1-like n=1 Tax=Asterias amurensis TaxID=7602 RepID=UPI003AB60E0C
MYIILILSLAGLAAANLCPIYTHPKGGVKGQYIISLTGNGYGVDDFLANMASAGITEKKKYRGAAFNGFVADLNDKQLEQIREQPDVAFVEEDSIVQAKWVASWGLDRVDQRELPLNGKSSFQGTGQGVHAFIIDTGIYPNNKFFSDRAFIAYDAVKDKYEGLDCNGHGTHCAGTIGGEVFGIAKQATLFGVKVLNCGGAGFTSDVIDGMDFVAAQTDHRPAVASMSLGGGGSTAMDEAVKRLVDADVTVSVAAGNEYGDACNGSPARSKEAITVGATDIEDERAAFSNYGSCVDIFAPGVDIPSLWLGDYDVNIISGTSMACPHVTGGAVLAVGNEPKLKSTDVKAKVLKNATPGVVKNPGPDSPNLMLYIP